MPAGDHGATDPPHVPSPPGMLATPPGLTLRGTSMDQAAIDALVYWAGAFFLGGFTVGVIVKLLLGTTE